MFNKLSTFLDSFLTTEPDGNSNQSERLSLASAALMVEVLVSDYERKPEERETLLTVLKQAFSLDDNAATQLLSQAEQAHNESTDNFRFTTLINENCSPEEKSELLENLWRVAYADGELHHYEEFVIRRIADLLHLSHNDFITAKLKVTG